MKSNNRLLGVSIMFLVFAIVFALVIWKDTSLSAILAFFATGFGCGISTGVWFARRGK
jgi:hypothetical protein